MRKLIADLIVQVYSEPQGTIRLRSRLLSPNNAMPSDRRKIGRRPMRWPRAQATMNVTSGLDQTGRADLLAPISSVPRG